MTTFLTPFLDNSPTRLLWKIRYDPTGFPVYNWTHIISKVLLLILTNVQFDEIHYLGFFETLFSTFWVCFLRADFTRLLLFFSLGFQKFVPTFTTEVIQVFLFLLQETFWPRSKLLYHSSCVAIPKFDIHVVRLQPLKNILEETFSWMKVRFCAAGKFGIRLFCNNACVATIEVHL